MLRLVESLGIQRVICAALLFVSVVSSPESARAQAANAPEAANQFEALSGVVKPGDLVTVVQTDGARFNGRLAELKSTTIAVDADSKQRRTFPATDVGRIVKRDSVSNGIKIGAGIGAAVGLAFGLAVNAICQNETGACPGAIVGFTAIGAGGGAAAGWGLDRMVGNRVVFERSATSTLLPREQSTEIFGSLVTGKSSIGSQTVGVAAGLGKNYASGFGIEFELSSTLGSRVNHVDCVKVEYGPSSGQCAGSGEEGTDSLVTGSGRVIHTFSKSRLHPYVGGGFAVMNESVVQAFGSVDQAGNPHVSQSRFSSTTMAVPVSGGIRLALTQSLTVRPEFTYSISLEENHSRASVSVGIVYQFK